MKVVQQLLTLIQLLAADRTRLVMENVALRQQITVLKRTTTRARIEDSDRVFWILLPKVFRDWREHLHIVQPETVIRWHRDGFAAYWKRRSRSTPGRPPIGRDVIALIKHQADVARQRDLGIATDPGRARVARASRRQVHG